MQVHKDYVQDVISGVQGSVTGVPSAPTIFNVVVDAVVWHWVEYMVERTAKQGGCGQEGRHQNALFYADGGMMVSSDPGWMQGEFITLVGLFDWVGMRKNISKTFGMVCCLCQEAGTQLEVAYK